MQKQVTMPTPMVGHLPAGAAEAATFSILLALSVSHMLNDTMQSLLPALYPMLKTDLGLSYGEVGLITLAFQLTASLLQPVVGIVTDKRPMPYSLAMGMGFTLVGLLLLSRRFQPADGDRWRRRPSASGRRCSIPKPRAWRAMPRAGSMVWRNRLFQVGGNAGSALGPLLAAFIVMPSGQRSVAWFSLVALLAMVILGSVGRWYVRGLATRAAKARRAAAGGHGLSPARVRASIGILIALMFSKFFYLASISSYFTFYLMHRFGISVESAQLDLFVFLAATAVGTFFGGPFGDRIGRKYVIWVSILGVLPFTLVLPYVGLTWTVVLAVPIGLVLSSAFSAIVVYAQELVPGKIGTISGLFFGFAFGMGGLGAAFLGQLADWTSIETVYRICAFLPTIGLLTAFLPNMEKQRAA